MRTQQLHAHSNQHTRTRIRAPTHAQGEMGGTVFSYPKSWITIAGKIRDQYKGGANLLLGVMLNHAYLYGYINRGPAAFVSVARSSP